jgi:NAD(P)-dependent dehydrogenase (short-subunit alcohol dehydrogenase family)
MNERRDKQIRHQQGGSMSKKVALVVSAGDAPGSAIAKRFAKEGYVVAVVRRDRDKLRTLVGDVEAQGGRPVPYGVDARKEEQVCARTAT